MTVSTTTLDGLYKQVYADTIKNLVPACALIYKEVGFSEKVPELGGFYNQPVILAQEQGFSFFAPDTATPTLTGSVDMTMKNAQVGGFQIAGQSSMNVEAAKRAVAKGPAAFEDAVGLQMRNLKESAVKRLEIMFLYGQTGLSTVASRTNVNATTTSWVLTLSQWSAALWSGLIGAKLDLYQTGAYGSQTKINSNGALVVSSVNVATRTVTVTGIAADITAADTYVAANANLAEIYFFGAYNNEMAGLKRAMTNVGTLFNINAASFDLWRGNTYSLASPFALTLKELQKAVAVAVGRGLDEDVTVYVNINTWANLNSDQAALRQYINASDTFQNGASKLVMLSQNGKMTVVPHLFVKEGDAFIVPTKQLIRVGATDVTFDMPGTDKGRIFIQNPSTLSFEYRCYSNQALFLACPAKAVYINSIVN
jgi:hypothetical protein